MLHPIVKIVEAEPTVVETAMVLPESTVNGDPMKVVDDGRCRAKMPAQDTSLVGGDQGNLDIGSC